MMQKTGVFLLLCIAALAIASVAGCSPSTSIAELKEVEVKEYEGERLDSLTDAFDTSIKGTQDINISEYRLEVDGLVETPQELSYDDVVALDSYKKVVTLRCVEGWDARILWEGVLVNDIISKAKPKTGADTVIFHAADGYTTALPLDFITDNSIMLAYKMNDLTLPPSKGFPFQLIAEQKWGYKWIKWVTRIELSNRSDYLGYWEERGWDNDAGLESYPR